MNRKGIVFILMAVLLVCITQDISVAQDLVLTGHTDAVLSVSFSPDGQTLASGGWDKTVRLWDVNTGKELKKLTGHTHSTNSVWFSPDGQMIASGSGDHTIRLWDVNTGRELKKLTGHTDDVFRLAFSPDGQMIASGGPDRTVRLWDVITGRELKKLTGHTHWVQSVSFSPDSQMIASASSDRTVRLWDVNTGRELKKLIGHTSWVWSISFSPDGQMIASGSGDGDHTIRLWDVNTGGELKKLIGHTKTVHGVSFSPDGQTLASASNDDTIRLWDVNTGTELKKLIGHTDGVHGVSFSPDGQTLASASFDNTIRLWGTTSSQVVQEDTAHIYWADGPQGKIQRSHLDGTNIEDLVTGPIWPLHIALNMSSGKMYWTNPDTNKIHRANLDGTNIEDLVTKADGLRDPAGIALDVLNGKMYWTDKDGIAPRAGYTSKIQRANLDGTNIEDLVTTGLREPYGIALDVSGGKMYWADYTVHKIQRANLDGTQVETLVTGLSSPPGIALDVVGRKMYWTNRYGGKIQRANLDGTRVEDLLTGLSGLQGIALDVSGGKMYWADSETDKIQRANLDGTQIEDLVTGLSLPQGIALGIPSQTPPPVVQRDVNQSRVLFADDFSNGNLDKWTPRARIGNRILGQNCQTVPWACNLEIENGALKLVATAGGNYSVDVIKEIFPTENYAKYVLSFDWKSTVKETPWGVSYVMADFFDQNDKRIAQMLALNTGFPNRTFEDHGGDLVPGRYGGVFKVHASFDWEKVTLDTTTAVPRLNMVDVHRIVLRAEVYNDAGSGGDLYVDNLSFVGKSMTTPVVQADANGDGVVTLEDLEFINDSIGKTGENAADLNGDGIVSLVDLVLAAGALGDAAAAPAARAHALKTFTAEEVQQWLTEARLLEDKSFAYQRGIAVLEQLLALLTPRETVLLANYPNPFNPETWIPYQLAEPTDVTLTIYDIQGRVVRTLDLGHQRAGIYQNRGRAAYWDGRNAHGEPVASGVYFYTLSTESTRDSVTAGDFSATRKMLIRK